NEVGPPRRVAPASWATVWVGRLTRLSAVAPSGRERPKIVSASGAPSRAFAASITFRAHFLLSGPAPYRRPRSRPPAGCPERAAAAYSPTAAQNSGEPGAGVFRAGPFWVFSGAAMYA